MDKYRFIVLIERSGICALLAFILIVDVKRKIFETDKIPF